MRPHSCAQGRPLLGRDLAVVPALLLACVLVWAVVRPVLGGRAALGTGERVFTVADAYNHLLQDPAAWVGRTVKVRGQLVISCHVWLMAPYIAPCISRQEVALADPGPPARTQVLPITPGDPPPLVAFLRRLPLLGRLAPPPQAPAWGRIAVYRVRLQAMLCGPHAQRCYQGVLADAAPGTL